uniref:ORF70 n=1 Tax=Latid herpesvirus 1 TaxID=3096545 RepID=A0AB33V6Y9_9VIRU
MYVCRHNIIAADIKAAIERFDVPGELEDFIAKARLITFFHYYKFFFAIDPSREFHVLNRTLGYCPVKLAVLCKFPLDHGILDYLFNTTGIPKNILGQWIPEYTPRSVYSAICAAETSLSHTAPLVATVEANPEAFLELFALYNRVWKSGRIDEHLERCCEGGRTLYCILMSVMGHVDPELNRQDAPATVHYIRSILGLPPRPVNPGGPLDFNALFKHFRV